MAMSKKLTPREALYNICMELGPVTRESSPRQIRLEASVEVLKDLIKERETQNANDRK